MQTQDNIRVGKRDIRPDTPSHTKGVREGNQRKSFIREPGHERAGRFMVIANPRRSTGINPRGRRVIDPRMPHLTPP